jgi:hypothetical protein
MSAPDHRRRVLTDEELIELLREAYEVMEPVPQHVLDQGKAAFLQRCAMFPPHQPGTRPAHELRSGGVPVASRPDQAPTEEDAQGWEPGHRSGTTQRPASADGFEGRALSSAPGERGAGGRAAAAASPHHELPGGPVVLDDHAGLPGLQTADGTVHGDAPVPSAAQTALGSPGRDGADRRDRGQVVGLDTPHDAAAHPGPGRLKKAAAGLVAFALLAALAKALGIVAGDLLLLYLP